MNYVSELLMCYLVGLIIDRLLQTDFCFTVIETSGLGCYCFVSSELMLTLAIFDNK